MTEQTRWMKCPLCARPYTPLHTLGWCESCGIGESVIVRSKYRAVNTGMEMFQWSQSPLGKQITASRIKLIQIGIKYLHDLGIENPSILDVHCGPGTLIQELRQQGVGCGGFEADPAFQLVHKLLRMEEGVATEMAWMDGVDMLCCFGEWHVVERPVSLLESVRPTLVIVAVPTYPIGSSMRAMASWAHYQPGWTTWYYTRQGIQNLFDSWGFDIIHADDFEHQLGLPHMDRFAFIHRGNPNYHPDKLSHENKTPTKSNG